MMASAKKIKYLIIGNSAGAIGAAEAIREADRAGALAMVSDEPYPAYSRPLISDYLTHPGPIDRMLYRKPDFYEKNNIRAILGDKALKIDPAARTVTLESGLELDWQRLLLATGGTPIIPDTEGINSKNVFTFNRLDDAKAIHAATNSHRRIKAVVIGGGLIGVSVAEALMKRWLDVVIVELKDRILNTILDEEASAMETTALLLSGVNIITGHTVKKISGNLRGEVNSVTLDDGRLIPCDIVIAAIGVRPRLELAARTGIKTNRGIIVDRRMETSAKDIYACGDVAEAFDFVTGGNRLTPIWPNAYEGGRVAGLNMAGQPTEYAGGTAMNALKYFGTNIVSAGLVVPPDDSYETLTSRRDGIYRKVIIKNSRLAGLIYAGDIEKSGIAYNLMKDGVDVSDFKKALVTDDFGLASLPEAVWRPKLARPTAASVFITAAEKPEEAHIGD
jgi:NAD(P)H-nitrite reductase large subunit